jgi:peptidoglycan/LPS O-acetylase OafA/YrhL/glycosyltransferase involved in cell wall biosynthesis
VLSAPSAVTTIQSAPNESTAGKGVRTRTHVPELDGVRGIAIALVMALHFVNNAITPTNLIERAAVTITNYGLWGVDLFFVLSGFLITGILVDSKAKPGYFRNFFGRRALRIFPLYYSVLLVLTVLTPAAVLRGIDPQLLEIRRLWPWLWFYLTNFYLGPESSFSIPYVSHFWSLAVEEHFYLVWPFLIWRLPTRSAMRVCVVLGSLALVLRIAFALFAPNQLYGGVLTPTRLDALSAGAWFALAARTERRLTTSRGMTVAWLFGTAVVALSLWNFALHRGEAVVLPVRTTVLAVFFGAMIYSATYNDDLLRLRAGLRLGWLRNLGKYSYGLYVFHGMVAYGMHRYDMPQYFAGLTTVRPLAVGAQIASGVGASYAMALASYHLFELPFLSLKRRFTSPPPCTISPHVPQGPPVSELFLRPRSASIIINNYNYEQFVGHAIESALGQTHPTQVIVVDDGSTDSSRSVIERYGSRVQAIFTPNGGQGSAMNVGFAVATGDIVMFLDADDLLGPTAVETIIARWQPEAVIAQYPLNIIDCDGATIGVHPDPPSRLSHGDVRDELLKTGSFGSNVTSGLAFSRRALAQVMPLPADEFRNAADGYMVRATAFLGLVQRLGERLGSYRSHDRNDSNVCVSPGGLADGFRKKIRYAQKELEVTRRFAAKHRLRVESDIGEQDADYIGYRLFLLLVDPGSRSVSGDRRFDLLRRYVIARWKSAWPLSRRALAVGLALGAAVSPAPVAATLVRWLHDQETRPGWMRRVSRLARWS